LDQVLTTLRLTWRWRGRALRALVLPLLAIAGLALIEWYTYAIIRLQFAVGQRFFNDPESLVALILVRGGVMALYVAGPAVAIATMLSTAVAQPETPRWLPAPRALALVAAIVVVDLAGMALTSYARETAFAYVQSFGTDWFNRNLDTILQVQLLVNYINLADPVAAVVAIIVARAVFALPAARTERPTVERVVNAALLVLVLSSAFSLAEGIAMHHILGGQLLPGPRPLPVRLAALATTLAITALAAMLFATAVAVAAFAGSTTARTT
jgi:hypothetical protein